MNRKVLWSMIVLLWNFLIGFAILKLFFAQEFLAVMDNPKIIQIGSFIDSHPWATVLADTILSSLAMHFYLCACKRTWHLSVLEYVSLIVYVLVLVLVYTLNSTLGMITYATAEGCRHLECLLLGISVEVGICRNYRLAAVEAFLEQ